MRVLRLLLFLIVLGVAAAWFLLRAPFGPSGETFVVIPPGTGTPQIAQILRDHRIIRSAVAFEAWRAWRGGTLKAGEYRFDHPAPLTFVYDRLRRGDVYTLTVTLPEGYNIFDDAQAFESAKLKSKAEFLAGARKNVDLITDLAPNATSLEGYLFPDTYKFPPAMSMREMQAAMVRRFRQQVAALHLQAPIADTVTLASLIEKETPVTDERPMVASVFVNRMQKGMALATDPAVVYGLLLNGTYRGTIYATDLKTDTPYNTYLHAGLPPGPICSPGAASLRAALHPAQSDNLYFVADNAGHSRFATDLEGHNKNVAEYRRDVRSHSQ